MLKGLTQSVALGAPNVYRLPDEVRRTLGAERMDVCAFVGVSARGPCRVPQEPEACDQDQIPLLTIDEYKQSTGKVCRRSVAVAVSSWDEYLRLYGGFEGPGRLPYAVSIFFEQGGQKAYIVRIVHEYDSPCNFLAVAKGEISNISYTGGAVLLYAKNEGSWGNQLKAALGFTTTPLLLLDGSSNSELNLPMDEVHPAGTLLRLTVPVSATKQKYEFRFVTYQGERGLESSDQHQRFLRLNTAVDDVPITAEVVEGDLLLEDGNGFQERFNRLGLSAGHPRWMAKILYQQSELVNPDAGWKDSELIPVDAHAVPFDPVRRLSENPTLFNKKPVEDRYEDINHDDFFDFNWVQGNPLPGDGIQALTHISELSSVAVPDLYVPESLTEAFEAESVTSLAGAEFTTCFDLPSVDDSIQTIIPELPGLMLDPAVASDLKQIITLQTRLVDFAAQQQQFVVLLDVPPGLNQNSILTWRSNFQSSYAAAYYPWLKISDLNDGRNTLIQINPSAVAAGIIARQEFNFGVPHGPANVIAAQVVKVDEMMSPQRHDQLHPLGINIFLQQRDGVWLSAARTLSRDPDYRQLSVRRLMTMLKRVLAQQMFWVVFEPNNRSLWSDIRHLLENFLRQLFIAGAFKGRNEEQAFFVRCDGDLNHQRVRDAGQLIVEIGVAPAEPLEFIVVRIVRNGDGTLVVQS